MGGHKHSSRNKGKGKADDSSDDASFETARSKPTSTRTSSRRSSTSSRKAQNERRDSHSDKKKPHHSGKNNPSPAPSVSRRRTSSSGSFDYGQNPTMPDISLPPIPSHASSYAAQEPMRPTFKKVAKRAIHEMRNTPTPPSGELYRDAGLNCAMIAGVACCLHPGIKCFQLCFPPTEQRSNVDHGYDGNLHG